MDAQELAIKDRDYRLEKYKLVVSILTSLVLGILTVILSYFLNRSLQERNAALSREGQILSQKQAVYADFGRDLNIFYVYVNDVGDFASYTPVDIVDKKRQADRMFFMYRPYWSPCTRIKYDVFIKSVFQTYNGNGIPAQIRALPDEKMAAYRRDGRPWNAAWNNYFVSPATQRDAEIAEKYGALVNALLSDTVNPKIYDEHSDPCGN